VGKKRGSKKSEMRGLKLGHDLLGGERVEEGGKEIREGKGRVRPVATSVYYVLEGRDLRGKRRGRGKGEGDQLLRDPDGSLHEKGASGTGLKRTRIVDAGNCKRLFVTHRSRGSEKK